MTVILICFILLFVLFSADNPLMILEILVFCIAFFLFSDNGDKAKKGLMYFLPYSILTVFINLIFVREGKIILLEVFGRNLTLEALIYALIFSVKLLGVIYIFMLAELMIDSDRAVSYFSAHMPKSTLMLMIAFKLFPTMRTRLVSLKEIYAIRGVNYNGKGLKQKISAHIPIISILLETSMEGAFDIGEAAYIRGFLSGKRTIYDKQSLKLRDYIIIVGFSVFFIIYILSKLLKYDNFDLYAGLSTGSIINAFIAVNILMLMILIIFTVYFNKKGYGSKEI